ncbi:MAG: hypothetical protein NZ561_00485, partial [Phycisphaerae bacterium]|nr:hypothetical protein [Phycisphaerae bacterium]
RGYEASLPPGVTASLPLSAVFTTAGFRTRSPTSVYPGGSLPIPLGNATITAMTLTQIDPEAPGTLTPAGPGEFTFAVAPLVTINLTVDVLGNVLTIPGAPTLLPLTGTLLLDEDDALLTSAAPLAVDQSANPDVPLPAFEFPLPTVLPPGNTANLVFHLTLAELSLLLDATVNTRASGRLIPEPAWAAAGGALLAMLLDRPRRPHQPVYARRRRIRPAASGASSQPAGSGMPTTTASIWQAAS